MQLKNTFLPKLWRKNKLLFWIVLLYPIVATVFANTGWPTTPFYVYSMYSYPQKENSKLSFNEVEINGKPFLEQHTWNEFNRLVYFNTINHYQMLNDTGYHLPRYETLGKLFKTFGGNTQAFFQQINPTQQEIARYPSWLKEYTAQKLCKKIDSIKVWNVEYELINGLPQFVNKKLLLQQ